MRTGAETSEVSIHFALTMKNAFDGSDPRKNFGFLSRFVNETDMLRMSEAKAFIALPTFMSDPVETNFHTSLGGKYRQGRFIFWLEAVKHLLRMFAKPAAIREAMDNLRSIRQGDTETEESYWKRFHDAINRCGNVQNEGEKITLYIDGLTSTIRTIVARHRENVSRCDLIFEVIALVRRVAICHTCYGKGHINLSCTHLIFDLGTIVKK